MPLMAGLRDALGQRGESIFRVLITKFHADHGPLFNVQFLGDKWPCVDFIVELVGAGPTVPYFFVQVKATRRGYTKQTNRLRVGVPGHKVKELAAYPAPTYVVGIDEIQECGYIVSAMGRSIRSLPSLSTQYPIDSENRAALWLEVRNFWNGFKRQSMKSRFVDRDWR